MFRIVTSEQELRPAWNTLVEREESFSIMQSWDWRMVKSTAMRPDWRRLMSSNRIVEWTRWIYTVES